jgi:DNA-binding NarL/FixJ family response regulator
VIAERLDVSIETVRTHVKRIFSGGGVRFLIQGTRDTRSAIQMYALGCAVTQLDRAAR